MALPTLVTSPVRFALVVTVAAFPDVLLVRVADPFSPMVITGVVVGLLTLAVIGLVGLTDTDVTAVVR